MASGSDWLEMAAGKNPADATMQGLSGTILAIFGGVIMVLESAFDGITQLLDVFSAARDFFTTMLVAPTAVIEGSVAQTVYSLTQGDWSFFGPLTLTVGVGSIALAWYVWSVMDPEVPLVDDLLPGR